MAAIDDINNPNMIGIEYGLGKKAGRARRKSRQLIPDLVWNVLTMLVWLGIAVMVMAFLSIYNDPASMLNLLPPSYASVMELINPPSAAAAALPVETQTNTATAVPTATFTFTPLPPTATATYTPEPTATETPMPGPSATPTIKALYPFILRNDPIAIAGDAFPEHDTCKLWIAGQSYDLQGAPMVGITVMLGGHLDGYTLYQLSLTGTALQFGQAGYEFTVADQPVKSKSAVWVQLFDQAMMPLSSRIYLDTSADCKENLILVNFRQVR